MIESVTLYRIGKNVEVRYKNGYHRMYHEIPQNAIDFILREDVKAFENQISVMYRVV